MLNACDDSGASFTARFAAAITPRTRVVILNSPGNPTGTVQPDEVQMYREATAGEVVNTILGNCTMDLQKLGQQIISMTPPIVLDHTKTIRRMKNSMFYTQTLHTKFGSMTISLVGSRELFNANLDYAK